MTSPIQGQPVSGQGSVARDSIRNKWQGVVRNCVDQGIDKSLESLQKDVSLQVALSLGMEEAKIALNCTSDKLANRELNEKQKKDLLSLLRYLVQQVERGADKNAIKEELVRAKKVLRHGWVGITAKPIFSEKASVSEVTQKHRITRIFKPLISLLNLLRNRIKALFVSSTPSTASLVMKIEKRPWNEALEWNAERAGKIKSPGYQYTPEEHEKDKKELLAILAEHNKAFKNRSDLFGPATEGLFEKAEIEEGSEVYVRADLHSDVGSLLLLLKTLQAQGKLDKNFKCQSGFHMVFLGDYMDRGHNDIEVMSILLKLRLENPQQVHLIRGNHEDVDVGKSYSEEWKWIKENRETLENCYKTLPLAFFVACNTPGESGVREYAHFSHGAFSTLVDPIAFLDGKEDVRPVDAFLISSSPTRKEEPEQGVRSLTKKQVAEETVMRVREVESSLESKTSGYTWGDVVEKQSPSGEDFSVDLRSGRNKYSPELLQAVSRLKSGTSRIKTYWRGHSHEAKEYTVQKKTSGSKVIATTLATGTVGGSYQTMLGRAGRPQPLQGVLLKVGKRMREWKKTPPLLSGEGKEAKLSFGEEVGVYEDVVPKATLGPPR